MLSEHADLKEDFKVFSKYHKLCLYVFDYPVREDILHYIRNLNPTDESLAIAGGMLGGRSGWYFLQRVVPLPQAIEGLCYHCDNHGILSILKSYFCSCFK